MRGASVRFLGILIVGLFFGGTARAGYLYSYHWGIRPGPVIASGTGSVAMALGQGGVGSGRILVAAATTTSSAANSSPDRFNKSFSLTMRLTDSASRQSGTLTFQGTIRGTLSFDRTNLVERFRTPIERIKLGGRTYYVEMPSNIWLRPPGSSTVPMIYAKVWTVNPPPPRRPPHPPIWVAATIHTASISAPTDAASAPEPSALVLAGLGFALAGAVGACRSRWRFAV